MTNPMTRIIDGDTVTDREMTDKETAAYLITSDTTTQDAERATLVATIRAARGHAASLGFTDAMLAVMYPNLTP